jgi:hypothetical protein
MMQGKPRPALFRALGKSDPPDCITLQNRNYSLAQIFKHDSWAATALYESDGKKVICKFNRKQSIFGLSMSWLGRFLAKREAFFYSILADLPSIPLGLGPARVGEKIQSNSFAHDYIEGHPLQADDRLSESFYLELQEQLEQMHERGIAYMDLHKKENIIVGDDGRGYFVDFQVSFHCHPNHLFSPSRYFFRFFKKADDYHLLKHRLANHSSRETRDTLEQNRPFWIRLHRFFAVPLRTLRRRLLVLLGIRTGQGSVKTESFTEYGLR